MWLCRPRFSLTSPRTEFNSVSWSSSSAFVLSNVQQRFVEQFFGVCPEQSSAAFCGADHRNLFLVCTWRSSSRSFPGQSSTAFRGEEHLRFLPAFWGADHRNFFRVVHMEPGQVSTEFGGAHHHDFLPGQGSPAFCGVDLWLTPRVEELKPRRDLRRLPKEFHTLSMCTRCSHLEIWTVFPLRPLTRCFCDCLR